jgi:hypothetical protein
MSAAHVGDIPVVRACITSFKTTEEDIEWVVSEMNRLVEPKTIITPADDDQYAAAGEGRGNR